MHAFFSNAVSIAWSVVVPCSFFLEREAQIFISLLLSFSVQTACDQIFHKKDNLLVKITPTKISTPRVANPSVQTGEKYTGRMICMHIDAALKSVEEKDRCPGWKKGKCPLERKSSDEGEKSSCSAQ